jgi:type 1 glutamine amidotransferase
MRPLASLAILLCLFGFPTTNVQAIEPVKILVITGGCCHDYEYQTRAMHEAFEERNIPVDWKVVNDGGKGTKAEIGLYADKDWAKGFDVVIHNECFADTMSEEYIRGITKAHEGGANAVVIHCAMHTYRATKIDEWRKFLGVTSRHHDHQSKYPVKVIADKHLIMKDFPNDWVTPKDELYIIETVWQTAEVLATSLSEKDGSSHPVFWTNKFGSARVFGTTFGHTNETFDDKFFRQALVRGTLWAAGKLEQFDAAK